jgi:outer membrane protein assembly factor BamB
MVCSATALQYKKISSGNNYIFCLNKKNGKLIWNNMAKQTSSYEEYGA